LTFWLSWGRIFKNLIKEIALPLLLFLLTVLFWYFKGFGTGFFNNLFALFLFLGALFFYIKNRSEAIDFLIFLALFLGLFDLYNIQYTFFIPSLMAQLFVFVYTFLLFLYLSYEKRHLKKSALAALGLSICMLEVFYVLSFWPTNPLSKSFVLTVIFYAYWFIIVMQAKIIPYLVIVGAATFLVLVTTRWPLI